MIQEPHSPLRTCHHRSVAILDLSFARSKVKEAHYEKSRTLSSKKRAPKIQGRSSAISNTFLKAKTGSSRASYALSIRREFIQRHSMEKNVPVISSTYSCRKEALIPICPSIFCNFTPLTCLHCPRGCSSR